MSYGVSNASEIDELSFVKELHLRTVQELGLDHSVLFNSGSSSSESSFGGIFSSSEAETSSGGRSCFTPHRSKYVPVATLLVFGGRDQQRREILLHSAQIEVCSGGRLRRIGEVGEGCGLGGAEKFGAETGGEARRSRRRR